MGECAERGAVHARLRLESQRCCPPTRSTPPHTSHTSQISHITHITHHTLRSHYPCQTSHTPHTSHIPHMPHMPHTSTHITKTAHHKHHTHHAHHAHHTIHAHHAHHIHHTHHTHHAHHTSHTPRLQQRHASSEPRSSPTQTSDVQVAILSHSGTHTGSSLISSPTINFSTETSTYLPLPTPTPVLPTATVVSSSADSILHSKPDTSSDRSPSAHVWSRRREHQMREPCRVA